MENAKENLYSRTNNRQTEGSRSANQPGVDGTSNVNTRLHVCPCGYYGGPVKACTCSSGTVTKYQKRISGPLLDRIDTYIQVPRVEYEKRRDSRFGETSSTVQVRVEAARQVQHQRADNRPAEIRKFCALDEATRSLMKTAMQQRQLLARAYHRMLKLARTIVDLAGVENILAPHLAEALQYRPKISEI